MPNKNRQLELWDELERAIIKNCPQLFAVLSDEDDFIELRIKARTDATYLAILKRYSGDGGKEVCFGSGYGFVLCLMALEATVKGNHWRTDKPWKPPE